MIVYEINPTFDPDAGEMIPALGDTYKVFWPSRRGAMEAARDMVREHQDGQLIHLVVTRLKLKDLTPFKMALACLNLTSYLRNFSPEEAQHVLIDAKRIWEWEYTP